MRDKRAHYLLERALNGELTNLERDELERIARVCPEVRRARRAWAAVIETLDAAPEAPLPSLFMPRLTRAVLQAERAAGPGSFGRCWAALVERFGQGPRPVVAKWVAWTGAAAALFLLLTGPFRKEMSPPMEGGAPEPPPVEVDVRLPPGTQEAEEIADASFTTVAF